MNHLRTAFIFCLLSLNVFVANASSFSLERKDFSSATQISRNGDVLVSANLSPSGKAKFQTSPKVMKELEVNLGGESHHFRLRAPISGDQLEMGPFSPESAKKAVEDINQQ